jgi:hypothetical protein
MMTKNVVLTSALLGSVLATSACLMEPEDEAGDYEDDNISLRAEPDEVADPSAPNDAEDTLPVEERDGDALAITGSESQGIDRDKWRAHVRCLAEVADAAYRPGDPGPITCLSGPPATYLAQYSTEVMKVWRWGSAPRNQTLIVSMKGTRITNIGDDLRDLQNIFKSQFNSPLHNVKYAGAIGSGWYARWKNQARMLKPGIDELISLHAKNNKAPVQLIITGHSMGGAVAAVAGYDIAKYLNTKNLKARGVFVYSFNPAKIGTRGFTDNYGAALFNRSRNRLFYRQFVRVNDPVHHLPPTLHHPVWNTASLGRKIGTGKWKEYQLVYCPQYVAPQYGGKVSSHSMEIWHKKIGDRNADILTMPENHLQCMNTTR